MYRNSPHHTHARCRETSDISTSIMWRNLKLLNMWRNVRFLHICNVEKYETTPHVKKFQISPHLSCIIIWTFSTWQIFLHISQLWYLQQIWGMALMPLSKTQSCKMADNRDISTILFESYTFVGVECTPGLLNKRLTPERIKI